MLSRREILGLLAAGAAAGPAIAFDPATQPRLAWADFHRTADYPRFVEAIRRMKTNRDAEDPNAWAFWPLVHLNHCPHGRDYFLAWHRGYLHLFETKLREISGSTTLRVPYWDYFTDPRLPAELTRGNSTSNPLFAPRIGADVGKALAYAAFDPQVTGFQRGTNADCFEARVEAFHNNVHNLVGGDMVTMYSPNDVLFWLHHANVDRLWAAWEAAGQGRAMPGAGDAYWSGSFDYAEGMTLDRKAGLDGAALGYRYADLRLPVLEGGGGAARIARPGAVPLPVRGAPEPVVVGAPAPAAAAPPAEAPMAMAMAPSAAPPIPYRGFWLGGSLYQRQPLRRIANASYAPDEVTIVLDAVALSGTGYLGGYFYELYLDLDGDGRRLPECLLGSIGPFQIAAARHHEEGGLARLELPVGEIVRRVAQGLDLADLGVIFARIDAGGAQEGDLISIGALGVAGG